MTQRFENTVTKLYTAFCEGRLDSMDPSVCAVGITLGHKNWRGGYMKGQDIPHPVIVLEENNSGYNGDELAMIEKLFLQQTGYKTLSPRTKDNEEDQLKGLCDVVDYLAKIDNISNPMDLSSVFNLKNELVNA